MGNAIYFCLESKLRVKEFICIISNLSWWCTEPKFTKLWPDQKLIDLTVIDSEF